MGETHPRVADAFVNLSGQLLGGQDRASGLIHSHVEQSWVNPRASRSSQNSAQCDPPKAVHRALMVSCVLAVGSFVGPIGPCVQAREHVCSLRWFTRMRMPLT